MTSSRWASSPTATSTGFDELSKTGQHASGARRRKKNQLWAYNPRPSLNEESSSGHRRRCAAGRISIFRNDSHACIVCPQWDGQQIPPLDSRRTKELFLFRFHTSLFSSAGYAMANVNQSISSLNIDNSSHIVDSQQQQPRPQVGQPPSAANHQPPTRRRSQEQYYQDQFQETRDKTTSAKTGHQGTTLRFHGKSIDDARADQLDWIANHLFDPAIVQTQNRESVKALVIDEILKLVQAIDLCRSTYKGHHRCAGDPSPDYRLIPREEWPPTIREILGDDPACKYLHLYANKEKSKPGIVFFDGSEAKPLFGADNQHHVKTILGKVGPVLDKTPLLAQVLAELHCTGAFPISAWLGYSMGGAQAEVAQAAFHEALQTRLGKDAPRLPAILDDTERLNSAQKRHACRDQGWFNQPHALNFTLADPLRGKGNVHTRMQKLHAAPIFPHFPNSGVLTIELSAETAVKAFKRTVDASTGRLHPLAANAAPESIPLPRAGYLGIHVEKRDGANLTARMVDFALPGKRFDALHPYER